MDRNYIRKDGFSNPDTERFFKENWNEERMMALCQGNKHCGRCIHAHLLIESPEENLWWFCLNEASEYFLETVHFAFGCIHQEPCSGAEAVPCPWRPESPAEDGPTVFEPDIGSEDDYGGDPASGA